MTIFRDTLVMKNNLRILCVGLVLLFSSAASRADLFGHSLVRLQLKNYPVQMKQIHSQSLDLAGVDFKQKQVDVIAVDAQIAWLKAHSFIIISNKKLDSRSGPDSRYQNPTKIEQALKQFAAAYPTLAQVKSIGKSLQGRDIYAIRITKDVAKDDLSKPHVFFNSMHHAREVMTSEIGLDMIGTLLSGYGKDATITHWLDSYVVDVIPMFNVDGNNQVWTGDSMWRKNARGGYGVDINRNYPYAWNSCNGSGSSHDDQDFHGDSAASEPETKVMMNFVKSINPVFSISYHSYSELVIYPFGCEGQHTPNKDVVEKIGKELASKLVTDDKKGTYAPGTAPELLYAVDGGDIDWLYAEAQVIPYVIEVNSSSQGFQPSYAQWRDHTVQTQRAGWGYLLTRMDGSSFYGQIKDKAGNAVEGAQLQIKATNSSYVQTYKANTKGYFNVIVNPGTYEVSVNVKGFQPSKQVAVVSGARLLTTVILSPKP